MTTSTDATDEFECIAEATRLPDGKVHFDTVILDRLDTPNPD